MMKRRHNGFTFNGVGSGTTVSCKPTLEMMMALGFLEGPFRPTTLYQPVAVTTRLIGLMVGLALLDCRASKRSRR